MNVNLIRRIDKYLGVPLVYLFYWLQGLSGRKDNTKIKETGYKKILFIKFWGIGNIAMLLPAVGAIKEKYKDAELDFLTLPACKDAAIAGQFFNNIYTLDYKHAAKFILAFLRNLKILRSKNYDLIIDFEQFLRFSALLCLFIGRKKTIGFNTAGQYRHFFYSLAVIYNNNIHMSRSFFSLTEGAGADYPSEIKPISMAYGESDASEIKKIMQKGNISKNDILITVHPGTSENFIQRRWPPEYYAALADKLIDHSGAKIIFTGIRSEAPIAEKIKNMMKNKDAAFNASGVLNFGQYICLIQSSSLVISADTASVHLASCFSVPVIGLYGPNTPVLYGPWGPNSIWFYKKLSCSPCITIYNAKMNKCRHRDGQGACMKRISVDEVFSKIKNTYFEDTAPSRIKKLIK